MLDVRVSTPDNGEVSKSWRPLAGLGGTFCAILRVYDLDGVLRNGALGKGAGRT